MPPTTTSTPTPNPKRPTLTLAEILSDLTSLRLCDPAAALALVSVRPAKTTSTSTSTANSATTNPEQPQADKDDKGDPDLQRAKDLVELHYSVKEAHKRGELEKGLAEAREMVTKAVEGA
ncbi:hypothetical protein BCR34DRAFT_478591 [Clohesyomyces aquaticus]|uniref:Uncharacterized protein n=1 Tax=Clohesyomyces aquaticus TaxID=1231657 RepID=A0A1Y1ZXQ8_9PLEO|nr:hypothetical protein BCR34DRAFT_478591 [Clohesyomyces aquaticus]